MCKVFLELSSINRDIERACMIVCACVYVSVRAYVRACVCFKAVFARSASEPKFTDSLIIDIVVKSVHLTNHCCKPNHTSSIRV